MIMFRLSEDLTAASGGLILIIILLIITAAVFAIKFSLDIALNKKLYNQENQTFYNEKEYIYAIKNETPKRRPRKDTKKTKYTIIPQNKLFIFEKPSAKDKY